MSSQETTRALIEAARAQERTNQEVIESNRALMAAINRMSNIMTVTQGAGTQPDVIDQANFIQRLGRVEVSVARLETTTEYIKDQVGGIPKLRDQITALSKDSSGHTKAQDRIVGIVISIITAALIAAVMAWIGR